VDTKTLIAVLAASAAVLSSGASAQFQEPSHPLSQINPVDIPLNMSNKAVLNVSVLSLSNPSGNGFNIDNYAITDTTGANRLEFDPSRDQFQVQGSELNLSGNNLTTPNNIKTGGQPITLRDSTNNQDILRAQEGGNLEIPNGNLDVSGNNITEVNRINGQLVQNLGTSSLSEVLNEGNDADQDLNLSGNDIVEVNRINGQLVQDLGTNNLTEVLNEGNTAPTNINLSGNNITDINTLRFEDGASIDGEVSIDGTLSLSGDLDMDGDDIRNVGNITEFFNNACGENQAVKDVYANGTFICGQAGGGLPTVLSINNTADRDINLSGQEIIDTSGTLTLRGETEVAGGNLSLNNNNIDNIASIDGNGDAIQVNDQVQLNSNRLKTDTNGNYIEGNTVSFSRLESGSGGEIDVRSAINFNDVNMKNIQFEDAGDLNSDGDITNGNVENAELDNSQVTIAGNTVSLGDSTAVSVSDLSDISSSSETAGQTLLYDATNNEYTNARITAGQGLGRTSSDGGLTVGLKPGNGIETSNDNTRVNPQQIAGDGLKETSATSLGAEPANFAGSFLSDDGSDNLQVNTGTFISGDGNGNIDVDISNGLQNDGSGNIEVNWNDANDLDNQGNINNFSAANDLNQNGDVSGLTDVTTDDLAEGTNNEYHTDERSQDAVEAALTGDGATSITYDDAANTITISSTDNTNDSVSGSNLDGTFSSNGILERDSDNTYSTRSDSLEVAGNSVSLGGSTSLSINNLNDVSSSGETAGQIPIYDGANNEYQNAGILGGTDIGVSTGDASITINHGNTGGASSQDNGGNTFIQDVTVDGNGHVSSLTSSTVDPDEDDDIGVQESGTTVDSSTFKLDFREGIGVTNDGNDEVDISTDLGDNIEDNEVDNDLTINSNGDIDARSIQLDGNTLSSSSSGLKVSASNVLDNANDLNGQGKITNFSEATDLSTNGDISDSSVQDAELDLANGLTVAGGAAGDGTQDGLEVDSQGNLYLSGSLNFPGDTNIISAQELNGSFVPSQDAQFNIGSTSAQWKNGYFSGTVTAANFEGSEGTNLDDKYVNEAGDTISGNLDVNGSRIVDGGGSSDDTVFIGDGNNDNVRLETGGEDVDVPDGQLDINSPTNNGRTVDVGGGVNADGDLKTFSGNVASDQRMCIGDRCA
jgi:hypothetical protein